MVLPASSPRRVGLLAGICWTKSQSPRYSLGLGAMVINDLNALPVIPCYYDSTCACGFFLGELELNIDPESPGFIL